MIVPPGQAEFPTPFIHICAIFFLRNPAHSTHVLLSCNFAVFGVI